MCESEIFNFMMEYPIITLVIVAMICATIEGIVTAIIRLNKSDD
jgi:hypothetical protein